MAARVIKSFCVRKRRFVNSKKIVCLVIQTSLPRAVLHLKVSYISIDQAAHRRKSQKITDLNARFGHSYFGEILSSPSLSKIWVYFIERSQAYQKTSLANHVGKKGTIKTNFDLNCYTWQRYLARMSTKITYRQMVRRCYVATFPMQVSSKLVLQKPWKRP